MYWCTDLVGPSVALHVLREARIVQFIALAWLLARTVDLVAARGRAKLDGQDFAGGVLLFKPVVRIFKVLALIIVSFLWLEYMGFSVATLELAGLTISGVAIALASQKTLENFLGAFTLMAAQPVRVGDMCRFGTTVGTVEEIGLRATRIRTLERTVLKIANAEFLGMQVHNLSKRDHFWYHPTLRLRYETTPDQIRYMMVEVRRMLYGHPKVLAEPLHVRFKGFAEHSLDLEIFAYVGATGYAEFRDISSDLNLRVMEIVAAAGTGFGVPTQIEYAFPGKPLDEQRTQAVETEVKEWKAQRALYLPDFPKETIAAIRGSLDYPPEGSPHYSRAGT
jgi:MscS family membrane protein